MPQTVWYIFKTNKPTTTNNLKAFNIVVYTVINAKERHDNLIPVQVLLLSYIKKEPTHSGFYLPPVQYLYRSKFHYPRIAFN